MNADYYKKYEPVFNSWYLKKMLGEGSYGKVFEIEREDFGTTYKAALKTMTIPQSESEIKSIMADGMDEAGVREYYENFVEDIVNEFVLMSKLKGNSNIVSYEDHIVIEHEDQIGWDILIRMELLTPLHDFVKTIDLTRKDVIQLGIDMCKALELCQKYNIIHRDIKPENIFVSENGDYKLGDFGIARTLEQTSGMLSKKGTQAYMAPEIYREESYGSNVDIYSLGIVMYRLLNENRTPFLPAYPAPITHNDRESAIKKRISGAPIPKPANADGRLAEIVLKACSYDPKERYFSPMEMREELEAILYNKEEAKIIYPKGDDTPIKSIQYIKTGDEFTGVGTDNRTDDGLGVKRRKKERTNGTEGMFAKDKVDETASGTEGMFKRKGEYSDVTESDFESKINDDEKTEGMFGRKTSHKKNKKRIFKNPIMYAAVGVAAVGLCVGGVLLFNNVTVPTNYSVSSLSKLTEPIEVRIAEGEIPQEDYFKLEKRLEEFGAKYYIDQKTAVIALNKYDLGTTNQEILATLNMLVGEGNIRIDLSEYTDNALFNEDFSEMSYAKHDSGFTSLQIYLTSAGREKGENLKNQSGNQGKGNLYVDDNLRFGDVEIGDAASYVSFSGVQKDGELSSGYVRIIYAIVKYGKLSGSYKPLIDEKYGITIEQKVEATEPPIEQTEEPVETVEVTEEQASTPSAGSSKKSGQSNKSNATKSSDPNTKPKENNASNVPKQTTPVQTKAPAEQPVQKPVSTPAQQSSASANENNLPEFYMDFE